MEDIVYNILWIDDDHETLTGTKGRAKRNGIQLFPFKSLNAGMSELEQNYHFYDGVLLDAKFLENEDDVKGSEDTENIHRAKEQLLQLKKKFEIFVLTGQAEAYEDTTFNKAFKKVYKKGSDEDIERLFVDIKSAAANQQDTQIRLQNATLFKAFDSSPNLKKHYPNLLEIIKGLDKFQDFNLIRKILESLFVALAELNIIPETFTDEQGWINGTAVFLSKRHKDYVFNEDIIHPLVAQSLYQVLQIVQDASHNEGTLKLQVDAFTKIQNTGYFYKSTVYGFLEVFSYLGEFMKNNQDKEQNKKRWQKKETTIFKTESDWRTGSVTRIAENGWGTFICAEKGDSISIHPNGVKNNKLAENQNIQVRVEQSPDGQKLHIKEIKLV